MGQSSSRPRPSRSVSTPTQPPDSINVDSTPANDTRPTVSHDDQHVEPKRRSRRSSIRRSVLSLVSRSPSSSASVPSTRDSSSHRRPMYSMRKRWRSSKRFSRASDVPQAGQAPVVAEVRSSTETADRTPSEEPAPKPGPSSSRASLQNTPSRSSRPSTPFPTSPPTTPHPELPADASAEGLSEHERQLSQNIGAWLGGAVPSPPSSSPQQHASPGDGNIEREINDFLNSGAHANVASTSQSPAPAGPSQSNPTAAATSTQTAQAPRHFPPPGTLVVVQGVVNTTDAPHGLNQPTTRPSETNPTSTSVRQRSTSLSSHQPDERRGLSSLLPRPRSMIHNRPVTDINLSQGPVVESSDATSSDAGSTSDDAPRSGGDTQNNTPNTSESSHRALSPGSIDVLGTLLSVAATATAASLFSPGLAHGPNALNNSPPPVISDADRPTSPTPTAGLGTLGSLNGLSGLNFSPPGAPSGDRDARERIRNVWDSFRDRLGLNSRPTSGAALVEGDAPPPPPPENGRLRPGELMLAEMARALNAGLGLGGQSRQNERRTNGSASNNDAAPAAVADGETNPSLSPEAGFERFLLNLQADLRTILSSDRAISSEPEERSNEADLSDRPLSDAATVGSVSSSNSAGNEARTDDNDEDEDMPRLETDTESSESEPEDDESETGEEAVESTPHPRTPTPIPTSRLQPSSRTGDEAWGTDERGRPTINLWRIYRFQPIAAPYGPSHAAGTTSAPAPAPTASSLSEPPSSSGQPSQAAESSHTPEMPLTPDPEQSSVVPVIVVGLQSVDTSHDHDDDWPSHEAIQNPANNDDEPTPSNPPQRPPTPQGRTWHSRAANALRTLRPGRRPGSRRRAADAHGSRTFLIYVIGGYYPPSHHMVTGSDSLDSYEALWELAELLGQVKPPVATKDEIEKSGLQIIKASKMKEYESEGKVASNCMDRCLVCLDDYADEDDIRVMSCKHAFHKSCVDRWLQVGRNNCPACRTKGVSTPMDSTSSPELQAS